MPSSVLARRWNVANEVNALFEFTLSLPRGALVEYPKIEEITRHTKDVIPWGTIIKKWRRRMLVEAKVAIVNVKNVGYRLLSAREQLTLYPDSLEKSADRKKKQALAAISLIGESELSETERLYQHARASQITTEVNSSRTHKAQRQSWLSAPETLPRLR